MKKIDWTIVIAWIAIIGIGIMFWHLVAELVIMLFG